MIILGMEFIYFYVQYCFTCSSLLTICGRTEYELPCTTAWKSKGDAYSIAEKYYRLIHSFINIYARILFNHRKASGFTTIFSELSKLLLWPYHNETSQPSAKCECNQTSLKIATFGHKTSELFVNGGSGWHEQTQSINWWCEICSHSFLFKIRKLKICEAVLL